VRQEDILKNEKKKSQEGGKLLLLAKGGKEGFRSPHGR
jgi:hypothetical protein